MAHSGQSVAVLTVSVMANESVGDLETVLAWGCGVVACRATGGKGFAPLTLLSV